MICICILSNNNRKSCKRRCSREAAVLRQCSLWTLPVLRAVLWLLRVGVLFIHLSKIIHHNEEKRPLLNNVKNSDLDPSPRSLFYLVIVLHRDWKTSHSIMKSCEQGNYLSQRLHRKKKEPTGWRRQQSLLFAPLSATQRRTLPHNGSFLYWAVCLYQSHFVLGSV